MPEYQTIIGVGILVIVIIGFYLFYCRLNDNNHKVEEIKRALRLLDNKDSSNGNSNNQASGNNSNNNSNNNNQNGGCVANAGNVAYQKSKSGNSSNQSAQNLIQELVQGNSGNLGLGQVGQIGQIGQMGQAGQVGQANVANRADQMLPPNNQIGGQCNIPRHGQIVGESRGSVSICANSEPSEESNICTNYGPIPDEVDNVQLHSMETMSELPMELLG